MSSVTYMTSSPSRTAKSIASRVCRVVVRVELQTPAKGADRLGHVAAMEVRHTQVIGAQHEVWILLQGFLVALDGLVEGSLVEVH
ncbi:MAG: hypothetical protein WBG96_19685, partial [Thermoanaerobaculia bacterium]